MGIVTAGGIVSFKPLRHPVSRRARSSFGKPHYSPGWSRCDEKVLVAQNPVWYVLSLVGNHSSPIKLGSTGRSGCSGSTQRLRCPLFSQPVWCFPVTPAVAGRINPVFGRRRGFVGAVSAAGTTSQPSGSSGWYEFNHDGLRWICRPFRWPAKFSGDLSARHCRTAAIRGTSGFDPDSRITGLSATRRTHCGRAEQICRLPRPQPCSRRK